MMCISCNSLLLWQVNADVDSTVLPSSKLAVGTEVLLLVPKCVLFGNLLTNQIWH